MSHPGSARRPAGRRLCWRTRHGFTMVELLIVVAIVGLLVAVAVPAYTAYIERSRVQRAVADLNDLQMRLYAHRSRTGAFPPDLTALGVALSDPWGRSYRYLVIEGSRVSDRRRDRNLIPINTDFDLYSVGPDGQTQTVLATPTARDDIIRAADGRYFGVAADF